MKMKYRLITSALAVFLIGMFLFFFYTPFGLVLQTYLALRVQPIYLRFYSSRVAATGGIYCKQFSSDHLFELAMNDLKAAYDSSTAAIAQHTEPSDLRQRAYIELHTLSYSNAVTDFEDALKLWRQNPSGTYLNPEMVSSHLEMAKDCAAAKQRYWDYSKNSPENRQPSPKSEPAPSDK